jgi:MYXO-CTERM domain-containing protein
MTGLVVAVWVPVASAKDLPNIDAFFDSPAPRVDSLARVRLSARGAHIPGLEPRLGVPTFMWGNNAQVDERLKSALGRMSAEQAARVHLSRLAELYKLSPRAADTLPAVTQASGKGPTLVTFRQSVDGVEVFRESLKLLLNERRELISVSGYLSPHVPAAVSAGKLSFKLDAPGAIAVAFENLNGERLDAASLAPAGKAQGLYSSFDFAPSARAPGSLRMVTPARVKRVFFPLTDGVVPAWYVELHTGPEGKSEADYYSYVISARDGRVLFRNNLTVADSFSYRVWAEGAPAFTPQDGPQGLAGTPHPTGLPDGYQSPFIAPSLVTLQNAPFSQADPWLPAGATETVGNNVDAYADISGDDGLDGSDFRADTTAPNTFDRIYDVTQEPDASEDQIKASVTQLFYVNNFLHDWFYDSGFNEFSGNAQSDNFGRGGLDNDRIKAEAQDISGFNNANMATPSDGEQPRMQMYLFSPNMELSVTVLTPPAIAGTYEPGTAAFGPAAFDLSDNFVLVQDAGGASPTDGCEVPFANAAQVAGNIAVIDRGNCDFAVKAKNAQVAGAVGVLIVNNQGGPAPGMGGSDPSITIPTLSLSQDDGALIKAELANGAVTARMYAEAAVFRDGALDNAIIAHEWGHYISNRLISDSNGLVNNQGRSMGEGWGDFTALLMMVREADQQAPGNNNFQGAYTAGGYVSSGSANNGYYYGVRRYPYSSDFTRNPLTFKHIQNSAQFPSNVPSNPDLAGIENSEEHSSGEVWATMLWECYTALLRDRPRLTFAQAQERMKKYLVLGYQVTPAAPTFIEARDALLASTYSYDVEDFRLFHAAFARRGAGLRAAAPGRGSTDHEGVVESFVTGKDVQLAEVELVEANGSCDGDGVLDNKEAGILRVTLINTGTDTLTQTTATVSTTAPGFTLANGGLLTFPPIQPFDSAVAEVAVALDGPASIRVVDFNVTYRDAKQAIPGDRAGTFSVRVNTDDVPNASASDDVESNIVAWASERDENLEDYLPWQRFDEEPDVHYYFGADAPTLTDIYLISPPLQVPATGSFSFSFLHRYAFEQGVDPDTGDPVYFDGGVIELSNDGGQTWTDLGSAIGAGQGYTGTIFEGALNPLENRMAFAGTSENYPAWQQVTVDLGPAYQGQTVQIRFRVGTDESAGAIGWDVDEVAFNGITNTPFPVLLVEQNPCSGNTVPVVNAGPDQAVDETATVTLNGTATDADGDALTLSWVQTAGPQVELSNPNISGPNFVAPPVSANTVLTFQLTANDGQGFATDTVSITVRNAVNVAPTADAGPDQTVNEGVLVTLDGRSSSDPDGDPLTYAWAQTAGTPQVTLTGANTAQPAFTAPGVTADALLTFRLTVSDGTLSKTDTVIINVRDTSQNRPPVAKAGPDQAVDEGLTVTLDGRGSSDPDQGTTLAYSWAQTAGPQATLTGANTAQPTFRAPNVTADTVLTFALTVSDGILSSTDTVAITVRNVAQNRAPMANAGPDQVVNEGTGVMLNGSGSSDPDGDPLTYAWVQMSGAPVTLTGANTAQPAFTAPAVTANTVLTFELTVSDGPLSHADTVTITVRDAAQNRAPVANAGPDQTVDENTSATLNGSGSIDPDNNTLTYAWSQTGGAPTVTLTGANTAQPVFTAPGVTANTVLTFTLTVSDGLLSHSDTVAITVRNDNRAPVANAGPDQAVDEGAGVTLNGSGSSDPDGNPLIYAWTQTLGPAVTLVGANTAQPTFTAPSVTADTVLRFSLTVSDGTLSSTDTVNITVRNVGAQNRAPVANAGPDQTVNERTAVTLNGSGSSDPDVGTTLTYAWAQTAGPAVTLTNGTSAQPSFTAPDVTADTVLTFTLTVGDGTLNSTDTVNITVRNVGAQNRAPVANAGADQTVEKGASVTLRGSATDPDGDTLTYAWTQTAGPSVTLNNANAAMATLTAPDVTADTVFTFTLKVTDPSGASAEDSMSITVTAKTGGGDGDGGGCGCSSESSAAGSLMPLLMIGMALLSRRRQWLR